MLKFYPSNALLLNSVILLILDPSAYDNRSMYLKVSAYLYKVFQQVIKHLGALILNSN